MTPQKLIPPMSLIDTAIRNVNPNPDKDYKLKPSEKGMYVLIHKKGGKYFRLDYRFNGQRKTLALGSYPEATLKQAREKRDIAKKQISDGIDPSFERKMKKLGAIENTFQAIALECCEKNMINKSEGHKTGL